MSVDGVVVASACLEKQLVMVVVASTWRAAMSLFLQKSRLWRGYASSGIEEAVQFTARILWVILIQ